MLLTELVAVSNAVSSTSARSEKTAILAGFLRRLEPDEASVGVSYLSGRPLQAKLGAGHATVYSVEVPAASEPSLLLLDVHLILGELSETAGPGSQARKAELVARLLSRATDEEQVFLKGLMLRNLRQGALEGVMADAVAEALGVAPAKVRRAAMLEGDLTSVASRALAEGSGVLGQSALSLFTPVQPMLAKTAESAGAAVSELGHAVVEQKLDGLRIQVHRLGDRVEVFSRNLRQITHEVPGVVESARSLAADSFILDGEALGVDRDGSPVAFQDSMSRSDSGEWYLTPFYFDILHLDGDDFIDEPLSARRAVLASVTPGSSLVGSLVTSDPNEADGYFDETIGRFFEGVVVKDLTQPYEAGRRGSGWLKVKPTHTLDLVVLAAEWGSGRRQGWLSNLHLGARDGDGFVMLGKTFKGLTDEMLAWQTEAFLAIEDHRKGHAVYLEPDIVYEIAFDGVQRSTRYPGGVALRFARVKRYRDDKSPADADTLETVRSFLR